jgi:hypothetical protein
MGAVPIALGWGADGESRQPLGLVIVGGLIVSQLITLFITPVIYLYLEVLQEKVLNRIPFLASHYEGHADAAALERPHDEDFANPCHQRPDDRARGKASRHDPSLPPTRHTGIIRPFPVSSAAWMARMLRPCWGMRLGLIRIVRINPGCAV